MSVAVETLQHCNTAAPARSDWYEGYRHCLDIDGSLIDGRARGMISSVCNIDQTSLVARQRLNR